MPQSLVNRTTGQPELIEDADLPAALASDKYIAPDSVAVHRLGEDTYTTPGQLKSESAYTTPVDPSQVALAQGHATRERANTGVGATLKALGGGAVSGLTLGLANPWEEAQEFNPIASGAGQLGGALLPALVGDDAGVARLIAGDATATEHVGGALSSRFLYGGEVAAEGAGAGLERGLLRAGEHLDSIKAAAQVPEDLAKLDAKGLRAAEEAELGRLSDAHAVQRTAAKADAAKDIATYQQQLQDANLFLVTGEGPAAKPFVGSSNQLRKSLDNLEGLQRNPAKVLDALETQGQALEKTIAEREAIASKLDRVNEKVADQIEDRIKDKVADQIKGDEQIELTGKAARRYAAYSDTKLAKGGTLSISHGDATDFVDALRSGRATGETQAAMGKLDGLLDANKALRAKIASATAPAIQKADMASPTLTAIRGARDAMATPTGKSLGEDMLSGSIMGHVAGAFAGLPIIGPMLGAKAGRLASDMVFGRMGKVAAAGAERTKQAADAFLTVGKNALKTPNVPVLASRVLSDVRFGPAAPAPAAKPTLPTLFKQRTDEIKAQTMYAPDGTPQMRPEARQAVADRLAPLRAASPILADRLETLAARRLTFLSSIIPRRPDIAGMQFGPDRWQPSELEIRSFARSVHAVEDPHGVEERLAHGNVTPEDAAAYHAVYPERAEALKQRLLMEIPTLQQTLPYTRRLALSVFTSTAIDPSLHPVVLAALQAQYAGEDGSEGGSQPPKAEPAFGSVRADIGSVSQQREAALK